LAGETLPPSPLSTGDAVRWDRYSGRVERICGDQAFVIFDGRRWRLPVAQLTRLYRPVN
jgi:hypothetical protein